MPDALPSRFDLVLVASSAGRDRFHQLASLAAAAAASDRQVLVVWRGLALRRLCQQTLDRDDLEARHGEDGAKMSRAMAGADLPPPSVMLSEARALGCVRYLACPTDVIAAGVDEAEARAVLDGLEGLTTLLDYCASAGTTLAL